MLKFIYCAVYAFAVSFVLLDGNMLSILVAFSAMYGLVTLCEDIGGWLIRRNPERNDSRRSW